MLGKIEDGRRRGWQRMNGWMASLTQRTWVWVNSGSWWWTGRPGVLRFMGSQRVGHDWETELNWTERRSPGEGNANPLQYTCLENPMDTGAWGAMVHWVIRVRHNLVTKSLWKIHLRKLHLCGDLSLKCLIMSFSFQIYFLNVIIEKLTLIYPL